jgi:hypothetical protein
MEVAHRGWRLRVRLAREDAPSVRAYAPLNLGETSCSSSSTGLDVEQTDAVRLITKDVLKGVARILFAEEEVDRLRVDCGPAGVAIVLTTRRPVGKALDDRAARTACLRCGP